MTKRQWHRLPYSEQITLVGTKADPYMRPTLGEALDELRENWRGFVRALVSACKR